MTRTLQRLTYACGTLATAGLLLVATSAAVQQVRGPARPTAAVEGSDQRFQRGRQLYTRREGQHLFRARNMIPGTMQTRLVVVGNDGTGRVRRVALSQDRLSNTGIGPALRLQIWDRTTNRCVHPAPPRHMPPRGRCRSWGMWDARKQLHGRRIEPRDGRVWKPGERHVLEVRFALLASSTNADQGKAAAFRLVWRAHE